MMASEEEELSERLQDETPSGSELEGTRRVQWPPANHQPLVSSIDLDLNMQEPMDDQQPDDSHLNEIVEPNSDPSNQLTDDSEEPVIEDTQIDSPDSNELNSDGKVDEETDIVSELAEDISDVSIPNKFASETKTTISRNQRRVSVVELAVPSSSVPTTLIHNPKMVNRRSSRPAIPGLVLSPPIKAVPYAQPSRPVITSHPVFKHTTPSRTLGATVWPPKFEYEELKPKCEEPIPPKRQQRDATDLFAAFQHPPKFSIYRPPPGTQHVRAEVVNDSVQL